MAQTHMLQLNPTIPVITADGEGEAIGWIDYSKDDDLMWIVFLNKNGECWIYPNSKIRACPNITMDRMPGLSGTMVENNINHRSNRSHMRRTATKITR
ncbi:MAG: hypothetical protein QM790_02750 [Nibricoccus sp.]